VQLENTGSGDAYNVIAELVMDDSVVGITTEYLGSLEREDLTSAIFDIYTPMSDNISPNVVITYNDAAGNLYTTSQALSFDVLQGEATPITTYLIWAAVIGGVIYYIYQRYKK
jgi:hypothetical protein